MKTDGVRKLMAFLAQAQGSRVKVCLRVTDGCRNFDENVDDNLKSAMKTAVNFDL